MQSHQDFLHLCDVREISWTDLVLALQLWIPGNTVLLWTLFYLDLLCPHCSSEYLVVCFILGQNNSLRCWPFIWKTMGKYFWFALNMYGLIRPNFCYQRDSTIKSIRHLSLLSRVQLTRHLNPWWVPSASSPCQTRLACPSSSWRWCRRAPERRTFNLFV